MAMRNVDVIDSDVLVIGGGFAGVWAALRAAELGAQVVLVDKAYVSRSGASTMSGGITTCPLPEDDLDSWVEEFVVKGDFMCDQAWTRKLLEGQRQRVMELAEWGVPIVRDEEGKIRRFTSRGMVKVRVMQYTPKLAMEALRREAVKQGVRIIDRFCITDLMTSDNAYPTSGSITGAFGFDVKSGACTAFRAKQTLLATGMLNIKGIYKVDNDTGDGVAMAWRAGARLLDMEFTFNGHFSLVMKQYNLGSYNVAVANGARLVNRHGERFMGKYDPIRFERSELSRVVAAFVREIASGNGPVYLDLRYCVESYWATLKVLSDASGGTILLSDKIPDPRVHPVPIEANWGLWAGGQGGIGIDIDCRTNLPGLFAAGSNARNPATGTHASAGSPTAFAMNSGFFAGEAAAREAATMDLPVLAAGQLQELAEKAVAPLERAAAGITVDSLHDELSTVAGDITQSMEWSEPKLKTMLARADSLHSKAGATGASSVHDLVKLHEARNVCENLRVVYLSALDRTESREWVYRSDFPVTDDDNWFCSHGMRSTSDGSLFERLPFPPGSPALTRAKQPPRPSPIAAIFAGTYEPSLYE
ncbi:FAD-dependent oxidoreductase [Ramlibacter sp. WS9]|uniref:FAD-dependent oxidoreductase n=1 Tax=Ramlibacter sp. WS9 TaxID=1882741 RepID=UPI001142FA6E|nr:FAD-binding protein [Ramlibacter sp. WS9]ROZ74969.1 FAD-dependent oxidoreductase [Ramlibacter sp. WS9]